MQKKFMIYVGRQLEQAVALLKDHGGTLLATYGQSILVRADDATAAALAAAGYRVRDAADNAIVQVGAFELDTASPAARSVAGAATGLPGLAGRVHHILGLVGPMQDAWKAQLEGLGIVFLEMVAENHYLVEMDDLSITALRNLDFVESLSPYYPALKVNPMLLTPALQNRLATSPALTPALLPEPEAERGVRTANDFDALRPQPVADDAAANVELVLFDAKSQLAAVDAVRALGATVVETRGEALIVSADVNLLPQLAAIPQVREVNPYRPPRLHNNVATGIIRADILQNHHALDGQGQIVGIGDTGLDTGVDDASMLADFQGRIVAIHALGRPGNASDTHGHGTHVAGSVLGDGASSNGTIHGLAPAARVIFQSLLDAGGGLGGLPANLGVGLFDVARTEGARIHTNSWGADVNGAYNLDSSQADTFAFNNRDFLICFSAGNDAPNRIGSPGTAKNVLTIGASENVRPLPTVVNFPASPSFPTGATIPNLSQQADNQNDVASFSSLGPAQNNRRKPDVVAPGSWILSTRSSVAVADTGPDGIPGTGDEDGVQTHPEAVGRGLPGGPVFGGGDQNTPAAPAGAGPLAQQNYMYDSGTSMATPITAGAAALVRQYLVDQRGHVPSAALLKALLINGAVDMGLGIPHNGQGWGRIDLDNVLFPPGTQRVQFDDSLETAVATGDIRTYDTFVSSTAAPLAVTLVWRDPAGSTIQNRLHLRVTHVASGVTTTADPIGNIRNNVQKVVIDPPQAGLYQIEVEGVNVTTAVPELAPALRQDYALVVAGASGFSCNPSDIVQVIDRSGSMDFSGYIEPAKERAGQMVDMLQINDKTGVVAFNAAASELFPLTLVDAQDDKADAHAAINPLAAGGTTDLREALAQGLASLGADAGRPRALVFLSDGKHTVATPAIDDPFLDTLVAANVKVYTIALGPDSDFAVLNNIAARTGTGAVYSVESAADLYKLHEIYYDILGGIGCGGVIHLDTAAVDAQSGLRQTVQVDNSVREVYFAVSWQQAGAAFDFTLQDPNGTLFQAGDNRAFFFQGSTHAFYRVTNPTAGTWQMVLGHKDAHNGTARVTTAALADTEVRSEITVDPQFLFHNKLLLRLTARHAGKPLAGGRALARLTYPTQSLRSLLIKHADALKNIKLDAGRLGSDRVDENLVKLGILAAQAQADGNDLFQRRTVEIPLLDDGQDEDPQAGDGIYTAFFDTQTAGVAGNFQARVTFDFEDNALGRHSTVKLVPVYVPGTDQGDAGLRVERILVRRSILWPYTIIGARVVKQDGSPMTPADGVAVNMTATQDARQAASGNLPYYGRGGYFIWRLNLKQAGLHPGRADLTVQVKLDGTIVDGESATVKL